MHVNFPTKNNMVRLRENDVTFAPKDRRVGDPQT